MSALPIDVVTGGAGFIGSHLVDALIAQGRTVRVIDNLAVGRLANLAQHHGRPELDFYNIDVADREAVARIVRGADRVFHLAAMADIVPSIERPAIYHDANVNGTFSVLEAARAAEVRRFIYTASSSCYGIPDVYPTPENAPIQPRYPYALTKYLGECQVLHWARVYDLPAVAVRLFNVYGPRARTSGTYGAMFGVFLAQLIAGQPLTIVGNGTQTRDFTFVSDVIEALLLAVEQARPGETYNVGTGVDVSVNRIVQLLGATATVHIPKRPGEPDCTLADVAKIHGELGWSHKVSIDEGVRIMLAHRDHWRDAPVWTPDAIRQATAAWFDNLGREEAPP